MGYFISAESGAYYEGDKANYLDQEVPQRPPIVPVVSVSPRQIRQALTRFGLRTQVEAAIAAGDQDLKDWYEFATAFERNHPKVGDLATGLGVSEAQIDALFQLAATL